MAILIIPSTQLRSISVTARGSTLSKCQAYYILLPTLSPHETLWSLGLLLLCLEIWTHWLTLIHHSYLLTILAPHLHLRLTFWIPYIHGYPRMTSVSWLLPWPKETRGRKGLFGLQVIICHHWTSEKELKAGTWGSTDFWIAPKLTFSFKLKATCLGMSSPTMGWALSHYVTINKISHKHAHGPVWKRQFLSWDSRFPGVSSV